MSTPKTILLFMILGLGAGAAYALLALGIVVIRKGSGVINFAQGGVAMFAAYVYVGLAHGGMPRGLAAGIVLAGAALAGAATYLLIMRPLRTAPVLARVVATLGLLTTLTGLATVLWGLKFEQALPLVPTRSISIMGFKFGQDRLWAATIAVVATGILAGIFRWTRFGLATRAASENERGAAFLGLSPDVIAASNWALGFTLGAFAGLIIAPITGVDSGALVVLVVPALAAALVGRLTSFGVTLVGALVIAAGQSVLTRYWAQQGVADALPFVIVVLAILVSGAKIPDRGTLVEGRPPRIPGRRRMPLALIAATIGITVLGLVTFNAAYQAALDTTMIGTLLALSLVVVTGYVGQISLAQVTFAGVSGFVVYHVTTSGHLVGFPLSIIIATLAASALGVALGLPAVRIRGMNLAVVTLAAAAAVDAVVFQNYTWTGEQNGSVIASPSLGSLSLDPFFHPVRFGLAILLVVTTAALAILNLRRSGTGRRMFAVRGNERAAAAAGINVAGIKLLAFGISAGIAGLAGGLLAYQLSAVSYSRFNPMASVTVLTLAYIGGIASVAGAVLAGVITSGGLFYVLLTNSVSLGKYYTLFSGVALLITVVLQPEGAVVKAEEQLQALKRRLQRVRTDTDAAAAAGITAPLADEPLHAQTGVDA
jgi:ABC-type branched-subunit amino acid transport system permease subunit